MNVEKLQAGMTFKNYKVLCDAIGEPIKEGRSKQLQLEDMKRYLSYSRKGQSFIIDTIFESPIEKIDLRSGGNNKIKEPLINSNPILASEWMTDKNEMELPSYITRRTKEKYWWKCSKCSNEVLSSPERRFNKTKGHSDDSITCPYCGLSKNAKKIYKYLDSRNISFEQEWMFDDLRGITNGMLRYDFAIFNKNKLIGLIEYDGEFHDEVLCTDAVKYETISNHDKLKDDYCNKNEIPLLRIHHTQIDNLVLLISPFLQGFDIEQDILDKLNRIKEIEIDKQKLAIQIAELNTESKNLKMELSETSEEIEKSFFMDELDEIKEEA